VLALHQLPACCRCPRLLRPGCRPAAAAAGAPAGPAAQQQWPAAVKAAAAHRRPLAAAPPQQAARPQLATPKVGRGRSDAQAEGAAAAAAAARLAAVPRRRLGQQIQEEIRREEAWLREQPPPRPTGACMAYWLVVKGEREEGGVAALALPAGCICQICKLELQQQQWQYMLQSMLHAGAAARRTADISLAR
jgi:hypothetical protein